jgi:hypothetical protein
VRSKTRILILGSNGCCVKHEGRHVRLDWPSSRTGVGDKESHKYECTAGAYNALRLWSVDLQRLPFTRYSPPLLGLEYGNGITHNINYD